MNFFFDSYAVVEIIKNNPNYDKYNDFAINTSTINVSEVYYFLLRTYDKKTADYLIKKTNFKLINIIKLEMALEASNLKFQNRKEKLSYIDCIGYVIAKMLNMKFLTGDEKFRKKENVEFVK